MELERIIKEAVKEVVGQFVNRYSLYSDKPGVEEAEKAIDNLILNFVSDLRKLQEKYSDLGAWDTASNEEIAKVVHAQVLGR